MESMNRYVGHIKCNKCGYVHITDPKSVKIWFAVDSMRQLCEVNCPSCNESREGRIDLEDLIAFRTHGVNLLEFGDKFEKLTEDIISKWDIDREFASGITKYV